MQLRTLLQDFLISAEKKIPDINIENICSHPERATFNSVFFYFNVDPDYRFLFADYKKCISLAIEKGAVAIVIDQNIVTYDTKSRLYDYYHIIEEFGDRILIFQIPALAEKFGYICSRFYSTSSHDVSIIAVTGTNGKTSTTHFISWIINEYYSGRCGLIGTLGYGIPPKPLTDSGFTTPDADILHRVMSSFSKEGVSVVSMEATSQGIDFKRLNGLKIDTAVFMNLGHEHLDYHGSMEEYYKAKSALFKFKGLKCAVVNLDSPYGIRLIEEDIPSSVKVYGFTKNDCLPKFKNFRIVHLIHALNIVSNLNGLHTRIVSPWGEGILRASFVGDFYIDNLLAAICCCALAGIPFKKILKVLPKLKTILGRMNVFQKEDKTVIVDFAHDPQALDRVLNFLSKHTSALTCVFGCGGMRDKLKRPIMAAIAEKYSSKIILTNNITRGESEYAIAADTIVGFTNFENVQVILDRSEAIKSAICDACQGEIVVICGRGHEKYLVNNEIETDITIVTKLLNIETATLDLEENITKHICMFYIKHFTKMLLKKFVDAMNYFGEEDLLNEEDIDLRNVIKHSLIEFLMKINTLTSEIKQETQKHGSSDSGLMTAALVSSENISPTDIWPHINKRTSAVDSDNNQRGRYGLFKSQGEDNETLKSLLKNVVPQDYELGDAIGEGDCFFDAIAQALNQRENTQSYTVKSLRLLIDEYVKDPKNVWVKDAVEKDRDNYQNYVARVQFTAAEMQENERNKLLTGTATWGRPNIEGRILCERLGINIYVIECREQQKNDSDETVHKAILVHELITKVNIQSIEEDKVDYSDKNIIHIVVNSNHFVPILRKSGLQKSYSGLMLTNIKTPASAGSLETERDFQVPLLSSSSALVCPPPAADDLGRPASAASDDAAPTNGLTVGRPGCSARLAPPSSGSPSSMTGSQDNSCPVNYVKSYRGELLFVSIIDSAKALLTFPVESTLTSTETTLLQSANSYFFFKSSQPFLLPTIFQLTNFAQRQCMSIADLRIQIVQCDNHFLFARLNERIVCFTREKISGGGNCGITRLGITREELVGVLLGISNNREAREALEHEIHQAFITEKIFPSSHQWQELIRRSTKIKKVWDNLIRAVREQIPETKHFEGHQRKELISWVQENSRSEWAEKFIRQAETLDYIENQIKEYCCSEKTYKCYVNSCLSDTRRLWIGHASMLLYAKAKRLTVYIWEQQANTSQLILKNKNIECDSKNIIHLLYTDRSMHFDLLLESNAQKPTIFKSLSTEAVSSASLSANLSQAFFKSAANSSPKPGLTDDQIAEKYCVFSATMFSNGI